MAVFKTSKEWARAFLLVSGTFILAGLYFVPVVMELDPEKDLFKYLVRCREKYEIIYTMLVTFYLRDKAQQFFAGKDGEGK
ncbi:MAG TPA: hypothetical protein ENH85_11180 [Candidatus Scalindua sp.]|nr:hypothetical protein [Candidatus Scalindua sp.]